MTSDKSATTTAGVGITVAIICCSALAAAVLLAAPLLVGELIRGVGFTEAQAGYVISAELAGMAFATLPAYFWLGRHSASRALKVVVLLFSIGNLATAFLISDGLGFAWVLGLRFLVATSAGSIMILCMTTIRIYQHPDRLFGLFVLGQLVFGAALVAILPVLFAASGIYAFYLLIGILIVLVIPLARQFPDHISIPPTAASEKAGSGWLLPALCLVGVFLFYVSLGGTWTYMERIGSYADISPITIGYIFSGATLMGVLGAIAAAWLGGKTGVQLGAMLGGLGALCFAILLLRGEQSLGSFTIAACLFKFCWSFALPFLLGAVARIDLHGRIMTTINLVIGGGTATGPAIAAATIGSSPGYDRIVHLFLATSIASLAVMTVVAASVYGLRGKVLSESVN